MNATGNFSVDNDSIAHLKTMLPQTQANKFPYFEALLRAKSAAGFLAIRQSLFAVRRGPERPQGRRP